MDFGEISGLIPVRFFMAIRLLDKSDHCSSTFNVQPQHAAGTVLPMKGPHSHNLFLTSYTCNSLASSTSHLFAPRIAQV